MYSQKFNGHVARLRKTFIVGYTLVELMKVFADVGNNEKLNLLELPNDSKVKTL